MPSQPPKKPGRLELPALVVLGAVFVALMLRTAWVSDDAYITLRTVDNFIGGHGLTWNTAERVQAYTHPLWMLALSAGYFLTHEAFYTTLFLSLAVSAAAFWLVVKGMPGAGLASMAVLLVLILSRAFMDYSTSGLENPATHALLAAFLLLFLATRDAYSPGALLGLGAIAGLATLNRMDTILFYLPALAYVLWRQPAWPTIRSILLGFLPFILWEIFALVYYGFPFPNPAYAKLNTGLAESQLLGQGSLYFLNSLRWDPITLVTIAAALGLTLAQGTGQERAIGLGIVLYLVYVLSIGGDFMSGRFLSAALLAAVVLLERRVRAGRAQTGAALLILALGLALAAPSPVWAVPAQTDTPTDFIDASGIADERAFYFQSSSLYYDRRDTPQPNSPERQYGLALRSTATKVVAERRIGYLGYFAGPRVHIVDPLGLADPLLARMLPTPDPEWRIGHLHRAIPDGYLESLKRDRNLLVDLELASYYDQIRLVTRAPLWSPGRFAAILRLNTVEITAPLAAQEP